MVSDILSGPTPIVLGNNWYDLEQAAGDKFRWASNDAELFVGCFHPYDCRLSIDVEPGPGANGEPLLLEVHTKADGIVGSFEIVSREIVRVVLPTPEPTMHAVTLRVQGGGFSSPDDDRILNFRVFYVAGRLVRPDVVPSDGLARVGPGWYALEKYGPDVFRWVKNEAQIEIVDPVLTALSFEVEPGPGVDYQPFVLRAVDARGDIVLAEQTIETRSSFDIPLGALDRHPATILLVTESGGRVMPGDARTLNFRVFAARR